MVEIVFLNICIVFLQVVHIMSSNSLHANDVIWLICKLSSKAKIFMQITKPSMININVSNNWKVIQQI